MAESLPWDRIRLNPPRPRASHASSTPSFRQSARKPKASKSELLPTPFFPITTDIGVKGWTRCVFHSLPSVRSFNTR